MPEARRKWKRHLIYFVRNNNKVTVTDFSY